MTSIIALLQKYTEGLLEAQNSFMEHLESFPELEKTVTELSNRMAADFLGACLTGADGLIRESGIRRKKFTIIRKRSRTLISGVGDITFTYTVYRDNEGHCRNLLNELIRLPDRERLTTVAEAELLNEASVHSYQHAADSVRTGSQTISKTTVMNRVHSLMEEFPDPIPAPAEKKKAAYLYIEADEDHIHRQKDGKESGCFIGKLIYLFEGKEDVCSGRRKLIQPFYFGGICNGSDRNAYLWKLVETFIREHYDQEYLKCVYISGDGGAWIRASTEHIYKSRFVADRFHLMKYISRAAGFALDSQEEVRGEFYRAICRNRPEEAEELLDRIENSSENSKAAVESCRSFLLGNWEAVQTAFHDSHVTGCSAEGHVSSVYSERMSSRPMGWSETGADRMCRLRCWKQNYGSGRILDLVRYRRERELKENSATGTDGMIMQVAREKYYTAAQKQARSYIERAQAHLQLNSTVRKTLAIREQISLL